ncbi:serine/threonine-protein phosphatase 6 regulatory ankyrin repeat subunit B-like protein [Leptotrombidium deliense]|uniref:Serine/threonine-protein phosphatase 6 regulatory ankyrin repeat subunit B-like protein n=1 Tax=Leptotrombidium deliense TaxID=299467 RepID=A0A443SPK6_9ACAR|nr:serine/threonine-protein phosphatase 6 regulatory ankyrin repeat subunit B-like protein [Leptotrombidium deliense]
MNANLLLLLRNKDKLFVEKEIKSGKHDLNAVDSNGYSPILYAAIDGNSFVLDLLIKEGVSFDDTDRPKGALCDPLHVASAKGHLNIVKQLIAYGANVNAKDYRGITAIGCAIRAGHSQIVQTLQHNGADLSLFSNEAANFALNSLSIDLLRIVIESGFSFPCLEEGTAFHYIIERDYNECCYVGYNSKKFIEAFEYLMSTITQDIDKQFEDKGTPLTFAFMHRRHHFTSRLINYGADVTKCDLTHFRFSSDAIFSLKCLFYSGFRFDTHFFRNNCHPMTPKNRKMRTDMETNCCNPGCGWLTDVEFKNEIISFHHFCKWIEEKTTTPQTLKTIARIAVRKALKTRLRQFLNSTNFPISIQRYLLFNDVHQSELL